MNDYSTAYAQPDVYDILHGPMTTDEVDLLEQCARAYGAPKGPWLEPACGTGRYLRELAGRGIDCTGFDLDTGMLDYARKSLRRGGFADRVQLVQADMAGFEWRVGRRKFSVAFNPVNSLRHLHRARDVAEHFRQIAAVLKPGGLYLVGMSFSRYGAEEATEDVWTARRGRCTVRQVVQYIPAEPDERLETVYSHLQVDRPAGRSYHDSTYRLRSYDLGQWKGLIQRSPLQRCGALDDLGHAVTADIETAYQIEILRRN